MMLIVLFLLLPGIQTIASPTPPTPNRKGQVHLVKGTKPPLSGPAQRRKVFNKLGWILPENEGPTPTIDTPFDLHVKSNAIKAAGQGRVQATPQPFASEYLCPVTIGGQSFNLNFDTGSADLWVFSRYLPRDTVGNHTAYNWRQSPTFVNDTKSTWAINYADDSGASGLVCSDSVTIGGVTQTSQAVELATAVSSQFVNDQNSDGLVGLGFDIINTVRPKQAQSWFQHVKHALNKRVFSVDLKEDGSGFYEFGNIPAASYKADPGLTRVLCTMQNGFWEFESPSYAFGGAVTTPSPQLSNAIADTGTTLLIVDSSTAAAYYSQIPGAGYSDYYSGWLFPCSQSNTIPSFSVAMGSSGFMLTIPQSILTYGPVTDYFCYGAVQDNAGYPLQIFGDVMYRSAFVAHLDWRGVPGTAGFLGLEVGLKA